MYRNEREIWELAPFENISWLQLDSGEFFEEKIANNDGHGVALQRCWAKHVMGSDTQMSAFLEETGVSYYLISCMKHILQ